jgi:ATPase subunit of ABC transporter with duplicated ATPase domains
VIWLEGFLKNQNIPMLIVSHDREFLDQVCNRIVDLEEGITVTYGSSQNTGQNTGQNSETSSSSSNSDGCNYSRYLTLKTQRLHIWKEHYDKYQKYIQDEMKWIQHAKNDPSNHHLVKTRQHQLEKYQEEQQKNDFMIRSLPPKEKKFRFRFPIPENHSNNKRSSHEIILESYGLTHGYGHGRYETLFHQIDFNILRGQRVGFIGPNGSGKSTMLRILAGLEEPREGYYQYGSLNIEVNYYAQDQADSLNLEETVLESVSSVVEDFEEISMTDIRNLLAQFMFKGDHVDKSIKVLSGGEKARVALCRMMLKPANLLLLDEVS